MKAWRKMGRSWSCGLAEIEEDASRGRIFRRGGGKGQKTGLALGWQTRGARPQYWPEGHGPVGEPGAAERNERASVSRCDLKRIRMDPARVEGLSAPLLDPDQDSPLPPARDDASSMADWISGRHHDTGPSSSAPTSESVGSGRTRTLEWGLGGGEIWFHSILFAFLPPPPPPTLLRSIVVVLAALSPPSPGYP
ncbi:unnamed protein product [Diplocarpon coronariae]|nr:hypothetical protein JHW43_005354 [Diplocarpon mali]